MRTTIVSFTGWESFSEFFMECFYVVAYVLHECSYHENGIVRTNTIFVNIDIENEIEYEFFSLIAD